MPHILETTDAAASTSTAYQLQIGQIAQGTLGASGDHDWYRVDLVAGQTYTFALVGTGTNGVVDPFLRLYAPGGSTVVASNDDGLPNQNAIITFTATTTGTYYIDAGAYNDVGAGQYGVSVALGTRATTDVQMGAGIIDIFSSGFEYAWNTTPGTGATVTVGFRLTDDGAEPNFSQFTAAQRAAVQTILQYYSDVCGLNFNLVNPGGYTDNATILLSNYNNSDGSGGYAYYPGSTASSSVAGDIHINIAGGNSTSSLPWGSYSFSTLLHELGHALGLSHPGIYNAGPGQNITYGTHAQFTQDTHQYTVMSYFDESNTTGSWGSYAETLMMYDIYALQQIYGVNYATRAGNSIYGFSSNVGGAYDFSTNSSPALCIWDGAGTDTLNCSGFTQAQLINLNDGTFSNVGGLTGNVSIALNAIIENAVGGNGNDTIIGNENNNTFNGGGGSDTIDGNGGRDVMNFNFASTSATIVHNANGSWTISGPGQSVTLTDIEIAQFTDRSIAIREANRQDFNGDGTADVLQRDNNGNLRIWVVANGQVSEAPGLGTLAASRQIIGTGDFNGDGTADVLWRDSATNQLGELLIVNGQVSAVPILGTVAATRQIVGTGDFNGDGTTDLLWRDNSGLFGEWMMSNGQISAAPVFGTIATERQIIGTGDFNGDGTTDILWRDNNGLLGEWMISNGQIFGVAVIGTVSANRQIIGTGDFNGDGTTDLFWRDSNGAIGEWLLSNGQIMAAPGLGTVAADRNIVGFRDFNNDGISDILWRDNATGLMGEWLIGSNGQIFQAPVIGIATTDWQVIV